MARKKLRTFCWNAALVSASLFVHVCLAAAQPSNPFRVGLILPLSGAAADYGTAIRNCIELAKEDNPELFRNIAFQFEDVGYDSKTAVTALNKLIDADAVNLSVTWGVQFCKALAPIAESRKAPLVGICLDPTIAANKNYILRFKNTTDEIMRGQAEYLHAHGVKRIGVLLAEHPYLEESFQALQRSLQPGQTLAILDRLPNNQMDLRTNIAKIMKRKAEFDSIGVFLFVGQISAFYRQARDLSFDIPTFGTDFFESVSEIQAGHGTMNGAVFTSIRIKDDFVARYRTRFHNESQLAFGAPAYEFAVTVAALFHERGGAVTAEEIMKSFSTVEPHEGDAAGPYQFVNDPGAGRYFRFPVVVKKISGEKFEIIR